MLKNKNKIKIIIIIARFLKPLEFHQKIASVINMIKVMIKNSFTSLLVKQ
jgi:hypothetical protein